MPFPEITATDMFGTESFAKRLFARIARTRHASIAGGRLFLTVETTRDVPDAWFASLVCLYGDPGTPTSGAGHIVHVRRMAERTYQLISDTIAPPGTGLVPLPKATSVRLVTRGGQQIELLPEPRR